MGMEIATRYDLNKHVDFILTILNLSEHETYGLQCTLELASYHLGNIDFNFNSEFFITKFAIFLHKNDIIRNPTAGEVYALSDRIISKTGRNFRLIELIRAFEVILRAWEVQAENTNDTIGES